MKSSVSEPWGVLLAGDPPGLCQILLNATEPFSDNRIARGTTVGLVVAPGLVVSPLGIAVPTEIWVSWPSLPLPMAYIDRSHPEVRCMERSHGVVGGNLLERLAATDRLRGDNHAAICLEDFISLVKNMVSTKKIVGGTIQTGQTVQLLLTKIGPILLIAKAVKAPPTAAMLRCMCFVIRSCGLTWPLR